MRADAAPTPARQVRPDLEERRRAKARSLRVRRMVIFGGVALVVALTLGIGIGFAGSGDRIAQGIKIAGVDVGGMTADEAKAALSARAEELQNAPVVFTAGGEEITLRPRRLGIQHDWDAAVARALGEGDGFILFRGFERLALRIGGSDVEPVVTARPALLERQLDRLGERINRSPKEAAIVLEGLEPVVVPAATGIELDRRGATTALLAALGSFERGERVSLPTKVVEPKVTGAELQPVVQRVRTAVSAPVSLAFGQRSVRIGPKRLARFLVLPSGGTTELAIGGAAAEEYFSKVAGSLNREPKDARFTLTSAGKVKIVPSADGRKLNVKATERSLLAAAVSPTDRSGDLVVETTKPKITTEKAKGMGIVGVVGSYTTTYGGDPNRLHNVALVAKLIDDHLIAPGEVFSFNATTGERNADRGFLEAPVIINGELQTGIGGGVCQVSTTVFNAAFEAGLSIEERTNHALYISHYPTGRDATVNYPDIDLKFKNDTGHWLWLRAFVGSGSLTINLYGTPVDRRVEIETSPLEVVGPVPVKRVDDPSMFVGETYVEDAGEPPRRVSVRRIVYDKNGEKLYDTTWYSSYEAEPKIVHVGTKPRPEATAPSEDAESGGTQGQTDDGGSGAQSGGQQQQPSGNAPTQETPASPEQPAQGEPPVIGA